MRPSLYFATHVRVCRKLITASFTTSSPRDCPKISGAMLGSAADRSECAPMTSLRGALGVNEELLMAMTSASIRSEVLCRSGLSGVYPHEDGPLVVLSTVKCYEKFWQVHTAVSPWGFTDAHLLLVRQLTMLAVPLPSSLPSNLSCSLRMASCRYLTLDQDPSGVADPAFGPEKRLSAIFLQNNFQSVQLFRQFVQASSVSLERAASSLKSAGLIFSTF